MAPLRISFLGGGSDISSFYEKSPGCVVSAAIDKYVYVHIKRHDPLFQERYRISYSDVEHTQNRKDIKNSIVRACLELLNMDEPLQISTSSDLPANSGLGSSSSFAVALLNGLHTIHGEEVSKVQIAEEACQVEIEILKSPIGKQDQYAAAFGGINCFEFRENGSVQIEPLYVSRTDTGRFLEKSLLIWTGQSRKANVILEDQAIRAESNFEHLLQITELAKNFKELLLASNLDWNALGSLISQGWKLKQSFSDKISTDEVRAITVQLDNLNCYGYKLLGAGGGGFIFAIFGKINENKLEVMNNWRTFKPALDHAGMRIVSVN